jgi:predicted component of type VI protein secretion system
MPARKADDRDHPHRHGLQRRIDRADRGHFDETGGNIGRRREQPARPARPERTISRVHAQIVYRNGRYAIIDRGSNAISVNGRPLGNGKEALLQPG